jgi:hypothetical protein
MTTMPRRKKTPAEATAAPAAVTTKKRGKRLFTGKPRVDRVVEKAKAAPPAEGQASLAETMKRYREKYAELGGSVGDQLAVKLRDYIQADDGKSINRERLVAWAKANGLWDAKYEALNNGQVRMNCGNKARALLKRGQELRWPE